METLTAVLDGTILQELKDEFDSRKSKMFDSVDRVSISKFDGNDVLCFRLFDEDLMVVEFDEPVLKLKYALPVSETVDSRQCVRLLELANCNLYEYCPFSFLERNLFCAGLEF